MATRVTSCTHCGRIFRVPETYAGRRARCKGCDGSFVVRLREEPEVRRAKRRRARAPGGADGEGATRALRRRRNG